MKARELSMGRKQAILKLSKKGKSNRATAQALLAKQYLSRKETTGVLSLIISTNPKINHQ